MSAAPGTMRSALRHRSFRRLLVGLAVSEAGDWLYNVALLAFVYERTHSAGWLAATTAARIVPWVVLGPLGGVIADRFDRRRTMIVSDLLRIVLMLGLAAVALAGLPVVLAPVLAGLATVAAAPYPPCTAATTPRLVPDADLPGANALRAAVGMGAVAAGPVVGAVVLLLGPPSTAFLLNAATFTPLGARGAVDPGRRRRSGPARAAGEPAGHRRRHRPGCPRAALAPGRRPPRRRRRRLQRRLRHADRAAPAAQPGTSASGRPATATCWPVSASAGSWGRRSPAGPPGVPGRGPCSSGRCSSSPSRPA